VGVAHLTVQLGLGHESGDGVDHQHIDGAGADEGLDDLQRLLAVVGLGDEEVVDVDAEFFGVGGIERVLGVDEGGETAGLLRLGDDLQSDGGLAGGLRAKDLNDAPAGTPPTPVAASKEIDPVEMTAMGTTASLEPSRMTEPLPNCFSSAASAVSIARLRSSATASFSSVEGQEGF